MTDNATWLPNLVGGVSIWKLAVDLNEPKFFDGRLLVPETEGSESLPVTVRWDVTGLVPLDEARAKHPAEVEAAVAEFKAALERVAKVFATPNSGYDKYKDAFTVPALDAGGAANYFYSPETKKLYVTNWGASPRAMGGKAEYVFGYEDWGRVFKDKEGASSAAAMAAAAAAGGGAAAVAAAATKPETQDEKKDDKKKKDEKKRPWWLWPLFALVAITILLVALFLLRACEHPTTGPNADAGDAAAEAGAEAGATGDGGEAGAEDAGADALADGGDDGGDAGAAGDAGKDGGDGGLAADDDGDDDGTGGGGGGGGGGGSGGGKVVITLGGAAGGAGGTGGAKTGPHRRHYQAEAVKWRIVSGNEKVSRTEQRGRRYDVWLAPGKTFQGVGVQWQGSDGKWHTH